MGAGKIQASYDALQDCAREMMQHGQQTEQLIGQVRRTMEQLMGGGWIGVGADRFFQEMEGLVMPGLHRLQHALHSGGDTFLKISSLLGDAENEAAALFRGKGDSASGAPGGAGGSLSGENLTGAPGGSGGGLSGENLTGGGGAGGSSGGGASVNLSDNKYFKPGGATPDTHWTRNDAYDEIVDAVKQLPGEAGNVKFFQAAERVTRSTMLGGTSFTPDFVVSQEAFAFSNKVGEELYVFNKGQAEKLIADPHNLYDPNGTGKKMGSAMEFDLNYVHAEQSKVESFIRSESAAGRLSSSSIVELSDAVNGDSNSSVARDLFYKGVSPVADTSGTDWAKSLVGGRLDFNNQAHREAIGKAMVFQAHGKSQSDYLNYMRTGKMP